MTNLLPKQPNKAREISPQQEQFLENLFDNGGNVTDAALKAGYAKGSVTWLRNSLADEIKWYCSVHNDKVAKSYRKKYSGNWYDKSKTPRNGVHKEIYKGWLFKNNWQWRALQNFDPSDGHKKFYDLPKQGRIIVSCRRHLSSLVDGVVHDTWNASVSQYKGETLWRSVLGYFHKVGGA